MGCVDPSPVALQAMPGWSRYWDGYEKLWQESYPQYYSQLVQPFVAKVRKRGCPALECDPFKAAMSICRGGETFASLRPFCPITCSSTALNYQVAPRNVHFELF